MHRCPQCGSKPQVKANQPAAMTDAFFILYECGSQILYMIEGDYWEWEKECNVEDIDDGK